MVSAPLRVVARRRYRASRDVVFRAFTDPDYLSRWFSPSDEIQTHILEFNLNVGGRYRYGFTAAGTENIEYVNGKFHEITSLQRLVFSWTWEEPDPHAGIETLVTVELIEHPNETEVVVNHERFPNQETCDRHMEGWNGAFDRLQFLIGKVDKD